MESTVTRISIYRVAVAEGEEADFDPNELIPDFGDRPIAVVVDDEVEVQRTLVLLTDDDTPWRVVAIEKVSDLLNRSKSG